MVTDYPKTIRIRIRMHLGDEDMMLTDYLYFVADQRSIRIRIRMHLQSELSSKHAYQVSRYAFVTLVPGSKLLCRIRKRV